MNDQAPPQANERDTITRYLDLATLMLLVLGLGSWVLSIEPPLLVALWSLAILMFALARVREFYMRYRYTRILYWLPLLAGNVKRRVYVRSRLGRTTSTQHEQQVAAGAADESAYAHAPETLPPEPESIFLPEAAEAAADAESDMPDLAWMDETQVNIKEPEPGLETDAELADDEDDFDQATEVAADEASVTSEEDLTQAPVVATPSVDPARLARLRSRLTGGAQALSHLAPPLRAEAAEPSAELPEDNDEATSEVEEIDLSTLDVGEGSIDESPSDEDASNDEALLEDKNEKSTPPEAAAELTDDDVAESESSIPSAEGDGAQSSSGASTALRDRLRQRQQGAAPTPTSATPVDSGALRDRLRQRINPSAAEADEAPAPTTVATGEVIPANPDAATRLRERLRQRDGGESN